MAYIKVLGAYGGKFAHKHTTAFRVSKKVIIDAGNVIGGLGNDASKVRHIFLTHAHLDHVIDIPFLVDSLFSELQDGITIHALPHTIESLKCHLMNDELWPDFTKINIPTTGNPAITYHEIEYGKTYTVDSYRITPIPANHVIPTCGFVIEYDGGALMLSGDTYTNDAIIERINEERSIGTLLLEVSFPNRLHEIAEESMHLTPKLVAEMLSKLTRSDVKICFYHMKPSFRDEIESELESLLGDREFHVLDDFEVVEYGAKCMT
ncbi:MAG: 3',5'-cyclic-nucleotide phosphodiesterase [Sulfurimonadaceae bacterium]|nr:3',5'-cyclic-nucleotide phosphodiesterase [Sulfurimonadaceae bacterium]